MTDDKMIQISLITNTSLGEMAAAMRRRAAVIPVATPTWHLFMQKAAQADRLQQEEDEAWEASLEGLAS